MLPILQIGPLSIQTSGLILLAGLWLGLSLSERYAKKLKSAPEDLSNLVFYGLIAAIVGARLSYALRFPGAFGANPASLLSLNPALLDPWGAAGAALLVALVYSQRRKMAFWPTLDALTPALAVLAVAFPLSQLATGQGYGSPSNLLWAIELWGAERHPTQLYAALAAAIILAQVLNRIRTTQTKSEGRLFLHFLALTAATRLFLEAFRGDSLLLPGGWRLAQIIAWLALAGSLALLWRTQQDEVR